MLLGNRSRILKRAILAMAILSTFTLAGCGAESGVPAESSRAVAALKVMLDGWKSGVSAESFSGQTPAIHVSDHDWNQGYKLVGYETVDDGRLVGFDMNYQVKLVLKSPKGKSIKRTAVYTVSTSPELLVFRQEG